MSVPNARKGVCVTLQSTCICRLSQACISNETSTKRTNNADFFSRWLARPLCSSSGFSSHLSDFCGHWHSLDSPLRANRSHLPSVVDCLSASPFACLLSDFTFLPHFWSRRRSRALAFVRVSRRNKEILWGCARQTVTYWHLISLKNFVRYLPIRTR